MEFFPGSVQPPARTVSCNSWKLQGSVTSGIYVLQDESQAPRLGYCDVNIEGYLDAALEQSIGYKIEAFPDPGRIMFSVYKNNPDQIMFTGDLTYNHEVENVGGHLDLETGIFKSPTDGSFQFTFSGSGYTSGEDYIGVYVNGQLRFLIYENDDTYSSLNYTWVLYLSEADEVRLRTIKGGLLVQSNIIFTFTGLLLKSA